MRRRRTTQGWRMPEPTKSRLLSGTIWMRDVTRDVAELNSAWNIWLVPGRLPVRACVQSVLQGCAQVEISVTAAMP